MLQSPNMATARCLFRKMTEADIPQVYAIDHECFPAESLFRPYSSYSREINNSMAHYIVACVPTALRMKRLDEPWYRHLLPGQHLHGPNVCTQEDLLVGFAGFWIILDEAHIIAIAVNEPFRRQRIGQGLLLSAIEKAAKLHARMVTLEVREKNLDAQAMYAKHGFRVVGRRPHYYSDNQEDAVLMTLDNVHEMNRKERLGALKAETLHNDSLAYPIVIPDDAWESRA